MGYRRCFVAFVLASALAVTGRGQAPGPERRAEALVKQLGSESFDEREQARRELEALGEPALNALRAAAKSPDLELTRRAGDLVRRIEGRAQANRLLAPKRVRLNVADVEVLEAVERLANLSGYAVRVDGDRTVLKGRRVTLDTGDVTFWEALDRLSAKAGLTDKEVLVAPPAQVERPGGFRPGRLPDPRATVEFKKFAGLGFDGFAAFVPVLLTPGTSERAVSYAGAVRVTLRRRADALLLDADAERRLLGFAVLGTPTIAKAVDEHDRPVALDVPESAPGVGRPRGAVLRPRASDPPARRLKELAGSLSAQVVQFQQTLATVDDLKATRKKLPVKGGGTLRLDGVRKLAGSGEYVVGVTLENVLSAVGVQGMIGNALPFLVDTPVPGSVPFGFALYDAQGKQMRHVDTPGRGFDAENGQTTYSFALTFRPAPGQGEPTRLVVTGALVTTFTIPFRFENVPLP